MLTEDVLAKYRSRRLEDLEICHKSLLIRDFTAIERVGHKLKGNGVTFGYPELSKLGEDLENSAQASDMSRLMSSIRVLEGWVKEMVKESPDTPEPMIRSDLA